MKSTTATPGRRSGPVQMRLFRVRTAERARGENTTPSPIVSPSASKAAPTNSPHNSSLTVAEDLDRKEAVSPSRAEICGSPWSPSFAPDSISSLPPTLTDLNSPATDDTLATPNNLRSLNDPRSPKTPASETSEGWSAVGKATISGRSGRVIERLQSDLDHAKRDNKSLQLSHDELSSTYNLLVAEVDSLRSSAETNETIVANLEAQAGRKDRKVTELKEDLAEQKRLRLKAETAYNSIVSESERLVNEAQRDCAKAVEMAKYHQIQYETLSNSMKQLRSDYEQKVTTLSKRATEIIQTIMQDQRKLADYEVEANKHAVAIENVERMNDDLAGKFETYKSARDEDIAVLSAEVTAYHQKVMAMEKDCQETVGSMKRVMNVRAAFRGEFND